MASPKTRPSARLGAHEGRLSGDYASSLVDYFYGPNVERTKFLFQPVMKYNRAHVAMLAEQGILDVSRAQALLNALDDIERAGIDTIELDPKLQGIYPNIEALVIDRIGYSA